MPSISKSLHKMNYMQLMGSQNCPSASGSTIQPYFVSRMKELTSLPMHCCRAGTLRRVLKASALRWDACQGLFWIAADVSCPSVRGAFSMSPLTGTLVFLTSSNSCSKCLLASMPCAEEFMCCLATHVHRFKSTNTLLCQTAKCNDLWKDDVASPYLTTLY